jgi:hypothetical protein
MSRTYDELVLLDTFEDRYDYLRTYSQVGVATFGFERWLNQTFYRSREWKLIRQEVIARDFACDLGVRDHEVTGQIIIHHMNPIDARQIRHADNNILDPQYLITCSLRTHNAIHFGDASLLQIPFVERRPGDTKLW